MKLATYRIDPSSPSRLALVVKNRLVDVLKAAVWCRDAFQEPRFLQCPVSMIPALRDWEAARPLLEDLLRSLPEEIDDIPGVYDPEAVHLRPPVEHPSTIRDFYAFETHVRAARQRRGLDMDPRWYELPVFYFSNPNALVGHQEPVVYPQGTTELDFELELAVIIASGGKNLSEEEAPRVMAGFTILNDWSARDWQREEMALGLGPAKGKDFATSLGPWLVTPDELPSGGARMTARRNGREISRGHSRDMTHSFAALIAHASRNAALLPGDVIGSGTVGTGCLLELGADRYGGWLRAGDRIDLDIEGIGILSNTIVEET